MTQPALDRHVFKTSRLAEFSSKKELVNQTGHAVEDWPLVVLKELVDNALDSTEEAGIAPAIQISVSQDCITIADNGPGIAPETVADLSITRPRASSREAYVSPTRGAQGNALKTILAMPFALDGELGETIIESHGVSHRVGFAIDQIRQEPRISHVCKTSPVKSGRQDHGPVARFSKLSPRRRADAIFTSRPKLHMGKPASDPNHGMEPPKCRARRLWRRRWRSRESLSGRICLGLMDDCRD